MLSSGFVLVVLIIVSIGALAKSFAQPKRKLFVDNFDTAIAHSAVLVCDFIWGDFLDNEAAFRKGETVTQEQSKLTL